MKRFTVPAVLIALIVVLLPMGAAAYMPSPRHGAFELRFGPHRPTVGSFDVQGTQYDYRDFFGNKESMFRATIEVDWQFARIDQIMSFGVGFEWGFMREEAKGFIPSEDGTGVERSSDTTALNVMPFAVLGVIRFDVLHEKLRIPFQPYFKGGLNWYVWWTRTGGDTDNSGGTLGWQINPGMAFLLDWIDETTARTFDNEIGVNNSYIFFELMYARVDGFGADGKLNLTPNNVGDSATWMAGLCLEF
ncbi:MAG: hypothetical protein JXX29_16955 [Deltaproteobacteria bacterium]|nr:hypothetical protein [Deltaproteobacteria bacterium]MBN2673376.1 hypothetical protein [Deltaproteobacteria bacterium]